MTNKPEDYSKKVNEALNSSIIANMDNETLLNTGWKDLSPLDQSIER